MPLEASAASSLVLTSAGLGRGGGQVEAQGVGVVLAEEVGHIYRCASALGEFPPTLEVQVFMVTMHKFLSLWPRGWCYLKVGEQVAQLALCFLASQSHSR